MKQHILFVCTHNAARSQMAEGYLNARYGDRFEAYSAGSEPAGGLNPAAVRAMAEIGIDIAGQRPKHISVFAGEEMDLLVAVCEGRACPLFPWAKETVHRSFQDPSLLTGTDAEVMDGVRRIRDRITGWIDRTFGGV